MKTTPINLNTLLEKFLWQMTGEELHALVKEAVAENSPGIDSRKLAVGVPALAEAIGCCASTIYEIKRTHALDGAIVSQIGKKSVFDVEMARQAADEFMRAKRSSNASEG